VVRDIKPIWIAGAVRPPRLEYQEVEDTPRNHDMTLNLRCAFKTLANILKRRDVAFICFTPPTLCQPTKGLVLLE
jgi:hypothetical protein